MAVSISLHAVQSSPIMAAPRGRSADGDQRVSFHIYYHGRLAGRFDRFIASPRMDSMKWCEGEKLVILDDDLSFRLRRMQRLLSERPIDYDSPPATSAWLAATSSRAWQRLLSACIPSRRRVKRLALEYLRSQADFVHLFDIRAALGDPSRYTGIRFGNAVDESLFAMVASHVILCDEQIHSAVFAASDCKTVLPPFFGYVPVVLRNDTSYEISTTFLGMAFDYDTPIFRVGAPKDPRYCKSCQFDVEAREDLDRCPLCGTNTESQISTLNLKKNE